MASLSEVQDLLWQGIGSLLRAEQALSVLPECRHADMNRKTGYSLYGFVYWPWDEKREMSWRRRLLPGECWRKYSPNEKGIL